MVNSSLALALSLIRLQEAEVEKARAVAQRALDTINFREEGEKMNVWVSCTGTGEMIGK